MLPEQGSAERLRFLVSKLAKSVSGSQNVRRGDQDVEIVKLPEGHVSIELLSENGAFVCQNLNTTLAQGADQFHQFGRQSKVAEGNLAGELSYRLARNARQRERPGQ